MRLVRGRPPRFPGASGPQRGAALIALVLALSLGSGLVGIAWLEAAARSAHATRRTEAALAAARDALIGYAVSYPDQHSGRHGPGYLPCPDTSGNGSPNTPCPSRVLGRLPWRRLGLHDPRDGAGERLWYSLARRYRAIGYKHRPMNVETAAELMVNGRADIAAVILAPGAALSFQDRTRDRFDPALFLEGGNETPGDGAYVSLGTGAPPATAPRNDLFNDRVATISRDELMAAASRRVLAAARTALERYRDASWNTGALPWLAPWSAGADGPLPVPGVTAGRLPVVALGDTLATSFRVTGSPSADFRSSSGTVDGAALAPLPGGLVVPDGQCTWAAPSRIDCSGESRTFPETGQERTYRFALHIAGPAAVVPPTPTDFRRRRVQGAEWTAASSIDIVDFTGGTETGRGRLEFSAGPLRGTLSVDGVAYPLGAGDEVPEWLLENQWHHFLMAAVAPAFTAGGRGDCGAPGRCLEVARADLDGRAVESPAIAVAIVAGPKLRHQHRGALEVSQWFEGENADPADLRYEKRHSNESFNDQVTAIDASAGVAGP